MSWSGLKPSQFTLEVVKGGTELQRKMLGDTLQAVIVGSPVDEGSFRGNHRVSVNSFDNGFDESLGDPAPIGSIDTRALQDGLQKVAGVNFGDFAVIQNNAPYSLRLENGWSPQTKEGIYKVAFAYLTEKYK